MATFTIHEASLDEVPYMLSLASKEGWAPGLHDSKAFYAQDPHGFFIGSLDNKPIGCISNVCYDEHFAFLGFYIVEEQYRRQGYGLKLWQHAIAYAKDRSIGLDGVLQEQANYKKSGFTLHYRNIRYSIQKKGMRSSDVRSLHSVPFEVVCTYDARVFGIKRSQFLHEWMNMPNAEGVAVQQNSELKGYGIIRSCRDVYKIGPLFAQDLTTATKILESLLSFAKDKPVYLDVAECNQSAILLAERYKGKKVFETARMYTKEPPPQLLDNIYGITSFELG